MANFHPQIDDYISTSANFAKPILQHLRDIVHTACPNVEETMKWSFPNFKYAGSILCNMAAFKQHCSFGFWLGSIMSDPNKLLQGVGEKTSMGNFGPIKSIEDIPPADVLVKYIKEAMELNEKGIKVKKKKAEAVTKEMEIPPSFAEALQLNTAALNNFEKFSPSHRKEYLEWISEAKTEVTRSRRIATALEWLEEGKSRNWKYNKC